MNTNIVAIHFGPKNDVPKHDGLLARAYGGIIKNVQSEGHDVVVTRGHQHYDFNAGFVDEVWRPEFTGADIRTRVIGGVSIGSIGVVRDLGKLLRPTPQYDIPLLNGPEITRYDHSKLLTHTDILHDAQAKMTGLENVDEALDSLTGDRVIVKPDKGSGGRGVTLLERGRIREFLESNSETTYVAQEHIDMTAPFPDGIKGISEEQAEVLARLSHRKKELRMFVFYGEVETQVLPVARMMKEGDETADTWAFVDPQSVPEELALQAQELFGRLGAKTGTSEIYGAADFIWGSTEREPDNTWMVGELNLWRPAFSRKNSDMTMRYDRLVAQQLVRIARKTTKEHA